MNPQKHIRSIRALVALTALACTLGTGLATAAPPMGNDPSSTVVRFADLNLASDRDVATLYERIKQAAREVCRNDAFLSDPMAEWNIRLCIDGTVEKAISDINRPTLTALHRSKTTHVAG
jgi:UrcA family protein